MCCVRNLGFPLQHCVERTKKMMHCSRTKLVKINSCGHRQREVTELSNDIIFYSWSGCIMAMADSCEAMTPFSSWIEQWPPITVAFRTLKTFVPSSDSTLATKLTVWYGFTDKPFFFEKATFDDPVICTVMANRYTMMLKTFLYTICNSSDVLTQ